MPPCQSKYPSMLSFYLQEVEVSLYDLLCTVSLVINGPGCVCVYCMPYCNQLPNIAVAGLRPGLICIWVIRCLIVTGLVTALAAGGGQQWLGKPCQHGQHHCNSGEWGLRGHDLWNTEVQIKRRWT